MNREWFTAYYIRQNSKKGINQYFKPINVRFTPPISGHCRAEKEKENVLKLEVLPFRKESI